MKVTGKKQIKNHVRKDIEPKSSPVGSASSHSSDEGPSRLTEKNVNNIVKRKRKGRRKVENIED